MAARTEREKRARVRVGESTYWSGLYIDAAGRLQRVDPDLSVEQLVPTCA